VRRLGFLEGAALIPDDFDTMGAEKIRRMFQGEWVKLLLDTHIVLWAAYTEPG
jgi:hypothetical protein